MSWSCFTTANHSAVFPLNFARTNFGVEVGTSPAVPVYLIVTLLFYARVGDGSNTVNAFETETAAA